MWIDLSKLPTQYITRSEMNISKIDLSLISTPNDLYSIGGYNGQQHLKECESFNIESKTWNLIASTNNNSYQPTSLFAYPSTIFIFGCNSSSIFEKLVICENGIPSKSWQNMQISNTTKRGYGVAVQINSNEILIFGGVVASFEEFIVYDQLKNVFTKTNQKFLNTFRFNASKPRIVNSKIYVIPYLMPEKKVFKIDIKELKYVSEPATF